MADSWSAVERRILQAINISVKDSVNFARSTFQRTYASSAPLGISHHQLLSAASYKIDIAYHGTGATGIVYPIASPQPSYFGMPTIPGSLAYMFEVGGRYNLRTRRKDPAVPVRASVQEQTNGYFREILTANLVKQGFTI